MTELEMDRPSAEQPEGEAGDASGLSAIAEFSDNAPNEALGLARMLADLPEHGVILAAHSEAQAVWFAAWPARRPLNSIRCYRPVVTACRSTGQAHRPR
jgi:hypothetical protein